MKNGLKIYSQLRLERKTLTGIMQVSALYLIKLSTDSDDYPPRCHYRSTIEGIGMQPQLAP